MIAAASRRMSLGVAASGADITTCLTIAQIAERGCFDALFLPAWDATPDGTAMDPVMLTAALSSVTSHIGLFAGADPTFDQPYNIARRFVSADQLSGGRAGWALVLGASGARAANFGLTEAPPQSAQYARAREFAQVVLGLWDSWDDDAFVKDVASGRYFDPAKMHVLDHHGEHFTVRGPLNVARSPQGRPVIAHDGQDEDGLDLAAQVAEVVYGAPAEFAEAQAFYARLKGRLAQYGRASDSLKILPVVRVAVGKAKDVQAGAGLTLSGTPDQITDQLQARFEAAAADGFILAAETALDDLEAFVDLVVPELQARGLFRTEYEGQFLRDRLGMAIPPPSGGQASAIGARP